VEAFLHRPDVLGLLDHTWSLAIEEQFYLVWPVALFLCLRRHLGARSLFVLALSLAVTSAGLRAALWHLGVSGVYYRTDARADGLLIGCAAAVLWSTARARELVHRWIGLPVAIFGVAAVAVAALRLGTNGPSTYDGALFLVVLAAAVVIVHTLAHEGSVLTRVLKSRPAVWIGARSYGIYLYHIPIFKAVDATTIKTVARGWPAVATETALTFTIAAASYRWVEAPFLRRRRLNGAPPHVQSARTGVPELLMEIDG
jgi:peptidoglycan/LPS O-acetylase OafA/YrhL